MRQLADEADRVGEQVLAAGVLVGAGRRVEGVEEPIAHPHPGAGDRVQEGRLAGVGVAGEGDGRDRRAVALGTHGLAALLDDPELASQRRDPVAGEPAIGLDLGLARSSRADAAVHAAGAEPLEVGPQASHAGEVVLELGQLDLELAGGAVGVVGEDVEDDRGPVDDRHAEGALEVALLPRGELVVAGDEVRAGALDLRLQLLELAAAEVAIGVGLGPLLDHPAGRGNAGRPQQLPELTEFGVLSRGAGDDADRHGTLKRPGVPHTRGAGPVAGLRLVSVGLRAHESSVGADRGSQRSAEVTS